MSSTQGSGARPRTDLVVSSIDIAAPVAVEAARRAEAAGFDGVFTYDHISGTVLGGTAVLDVWTLLGAFATVTERVTLGPLVLNATARHPGHINTAVATLQQMSGGRVLLGLGAGAGPESPFSRELSMFGIEADGAAQRRRRVAETVEALRALWRGTMDYRGEQLQLRGVEGVALPDPAPRIIVGANGPRMAALAGTYADAVNFHSWEKDLPGLIDIARRAADAVGRDDFEVTVEGRFDERWIDPTSPTILELQALGVARVQLHWAASMGLDVISDASRHLGGTTTERRP